MYVDEPREWGARMATLYSINIQIPAETAKPDWSKRRSNGAASVAIE